MDTSAVEAWIQSHLFEQVPQALAVLDREYRLVMANRRLTRAFGDWTGRRCYDVFKGRVSRCEGCQAARVFADGERRTTDEVWIDREGRHGHHVARLVPVPNGDGRVGYVVVMATDVTERQSLQREHQILFERTPCYVAVLDRQLKIVRANELLRQTFGDHVGRLCHEVYKRSAERCPECPALRSFNDGKVHTAQSAGQRRDGSLARYVVTTAPLARAGEPVEYVIEILHDVTDVLELKAQLVRERQLLHSIVDQSFDGIVATEADGRIAIVNPAAESLLGVTAEELRGSDRLERVYPEEFLDVVHSQGTSCVLPETRIRVGDDEIPIRFAGVVLRDADRTVGTAGFLQDLREHQRLEREKLDAERLAAVGQTVAGLAHGVKNILTGLEGGVFLVRWGLEDDRRDKIQQGWEILDRNFHKITTFVREFLNFAKGRVPVVAPTDLNEVVREVVALYREAARERNVEVETELEEGIASANLDAEGIHTCLSNLVSNAVDACLTSDRKGGRVVLRSRERDGCLELEVEDDGCGMDYEIKRKVFTSFFSTKGTSGTGLGLLVTKKVIQEHGGTVDIESTPGVGSTFRISLPRARLPQPEGGDGGRRQGERP